MADAVWDMKKAASTPPPARRDSDPGRLNEKSGAPASEAPQKALELAVPGGFRRHHVAAQAPHAPHQGVSKALREQIVEKIESVYNPFIGNILSQDDDKYDEMQVKERAESLLQTPIYALPYRRVIGAKECVCW